MSVTDADADVAIHSFIIIIAVAAFVVLTLVTSLVVICVKCPHYCVVDVITYQQEKRRLRRQIEQNRGKSLDLMQYLQRRQLQLSRQQRSMNTMALYCVVSEEMNAVR